jgi:hypothetical protein
MRAHVDTGMDLGWCERTLKQGWVKWIEVVCAHTQAELGQVLRATAAAHSSSGSSHMEIRAAGAACMQLLCSPSKHSPCTLYPAPGKTFIIGDTSSMCDAPVRGTC